jgi:hypothetical protein
LEYLEESKGMWQPELKNRKEWKNRLIERCLGHRDLKYELETKHVSNL